MTDKAAHEVSRRWVQGSLPGDDRRAEAAAGLSTPSSARHLIPMLDISKRKAHMRRMVLALALANISALLAQPVLAHGNEPHPKCKQGYVVNDEHKCVKKD